MFLVVLYNQKLDLDRLRDYYSVRKSDELAMSNLTEVLSGLQQTTQRNLEILKALNDSFYSKREHVAAVIGGERYVIPSFLYLESKIGDLENNFQNLVNAPKTGTAAFVFDGNTQEIQLKSFTTTPESVRLEQSTNFLVEDNPIFKDFLSPNPYIRMDLSTIGSDITEVVVKKVAVKSSELLSRLSAETVEGTTNIEWVKAAKILYGYGKDSDYVEYDTVRRLPVREGTATGKYTVKSIDKEWIDSDLVEHYTLQLNEKLDYWIESGTIQRQISVGDYLVTSNGTVKLHIDYLDYSKNLIECTVLNGAYSDLTEYNSGNASNEYATLKYFSEVGQDSGKHIDIPLEEDKNVMVFVAPLESRLNIQAPWGVGILIDTDNLTIEEDGIVYTFTDYYKLKINNIGDTLYGLTKMFSTDLFNMSTEELDRLKSSRPEINQDLIQVVEINSHLNDSESVQKIRSLHSQKSLYKSELETVQHDIDDVVSILSELSFSDTSENRVVYEEQLEALNGRKAELNKNISEIVDEISDNVNSADVPIENAKYHIRGFFDVEDIEKDTSKKVIRIDVEYRYKNRNRNSGTALSISTGEGETAKTYIYSDWNPMQSPVLYKQPGVVSKSILTEYPESTQDKNVPSFNQIDIPITQGETVDIRLRVQFSDGWPFIETFSSWSPIVNIGFPEEFVANVPIMRIIEENNEDAENYRFRNILGTEGVLQHVGNEIMDQDIKYFHRPENIASGFYTEERRVIPLKDKLTSMDQDIRAIMDEMYGLDPSLLEVTASDQNYTVNLIPYSRTTFLSPAYSDTASNRDQSGNAIDIVTITIANPSEHNIKLFTMFPGSNSASVDWNTRSKFASEDYSRREDIAGFGEQILSVWGYSDSTENFNDRDLVGANLFRQHQNQFVYFRLNSPYDGTMWYTSGIYSDLIKKDNYLCGTPHTDLIRKTGEGIGATVNMSLSSIGAISTSGGSRFITLAPGESVQIPLEFRYTTGTGTSDYIEKTVSFDVWTSLFGDPANYTLTLRANYIDDISGRNRNQTGAGRYTPVIVG